MHDPVAYSLDVLDRIEDSVLLVSKGVKDEFHAYLMVRNLKFRDDLVTLRRAILEDSHRKSDFLYYTFGYEVIHVVALHVKQLVLDRRTAAIDYKNYHLLLIILKQGAKLKKNHYFSKQNRKPMDVAEDIVGLSVPFVAGIAGGVYLVAALLSPEAPHQALSQMYMFAGISGSVLAISAGLMCLRRPRKPLAVMILFLLCGLFCAMTDGIGDIAESGSRAHVSGISALIDRTGFDGETTAPLVKALLTGDRTGISRNVSSAFRAAGASHILALSGLHLGVIYMILLWTTTIIGFSPTARRIRFLMIIGVSGTYAIATGASPSIVRAFLFILLRETSLLLNRPQRPALILCAALTIQLMLNPSVFSSAGFQLSYLAMAGITFVFPKMKSWYPDPAGFSVTKKIWDMASLSISCQLFTAPLVWLKFGTFPVYFLITNLIAMPLSSMLIMLAVCCLLLASAGICPEIMIKGTDWIANALIYSLEIISTM